MKHGRRRLGSDGLLAASPFLLPSVLGLLLFSLLPLVISALISLTNWNGLDELSSAGFFAEHFVGLENFKSILTTREFWQVLWNTLRYIVMYIPLMLAAAIAVATLLSRPRRGVTAFRIIYYIPVLTSWGRRLLIWKSVLSTARSTASSASSASKARAGCWTRPGPCPPSSSSPCGRTWASSASSCSPA
ncbi:MAG: carbohydrate ABC transporter permease [Lachnospiraceae bacterium]